MMTSFNWFQMIELEFVNVILVYPSNKRMPSHILVSPMADVVICNNVQGSQPLVADILNIFTPVQ